jgi:lipid-A-disaccharide synthase
MALLWQEICNDYFFESKKIKEDELKKAEFKKTIFIIKLYELSSQINSHQVMRASDLILCASGTTTLEAFLIGAPMVVAYKVSKLNELLLRLLIKVKYIAMPNILADRLYNHPIAPEFLQDKVTADNLSRAIEAELDKASDNYLDNNVNKLRLDLQNYLRLPNNLSHHDAIVKAITEVVK